MYTLDQLRALLKEEFDRKEYMAEPHTLFEPLQYILEDGGKRIRPLLALMAYNMYRDDVEKALKPAVGIEIFHNYTLLHDDVMDDADLRRGRPTVHKKWDSNVAILSGDAAAITAYRYIEHCEDQYLRKAIDGFNQVAMDVCKGQQYDMEFEKRNDVTEEEYLNMIYLKTAVLIAGSLKHGALIAGAPEEEYKALYDFGGHLGMVFQLQDDFLDVYGDVKVFGKNIGGDIVENKKTYLLVKAMEVARGEDREELFSWINRKDAVPAEKIKAVTALYNKLGIPELVRQKTEEYLEKSREAMEVVKMPGERKECFYDMIRFIQERKN